MRKAQNQLKKEVRKISKERTRASFEDEAFASLHETYRVEYESKRDKMAALEQRVENERVLMSTLGQLLDVKDGLLLSRAAALSDTPFVAKVSIFCNLCDVHVRSLVGALGRLGNNFGKAQRVADEAAGRLQMYVRNVLYGDMSSLAEDRDARRRSCVSVAHSQLGQDVAAATGVDVDLLRLQRGQELTLLLVLASQLLQQRFQCEQCIERVCGVLAAQCKNFAASQAEEKREAQPNSARSYKGYLGVEREKLLESLAVEVEALRSRLTMLQALVEAMRANTRDFVEAVACSRPFRLRVTDVTDPGAAPDDSIAAATSMPATREACDSAIGGGSATAVSSCDPDVRFWLQLNGLLRYEVQLAGLRWPAVRGLTTEELRVLGIGGNDASRLRVVQQALKIDYSDWFSVLLSGYLRKKGEGSKAAWRRRFFVLLANKELLYFKSDAAVKPQGSFFLSQVSEVVSGEGRCVALVTKARTYVLEAETDADLAQWLGFFRLYR
jgi:hypothetical protein